jgi:hypothetical protein
VIHPGTDLSKNRKATGYFLFSAPCLIAVLVLVLNDHILKAHFGLGPISVITGKLSDFAGAIILPAWLEFVMAAFIGQRRDRALTLAVIASCAGLVAIELSPVAINIYESINNVFLSFFAQITSTKPSLTKLTADLSDLLALALIPWVRKKCQEFHTKSSAFSIAKA